MFSLPDTTEKLGWRDLVLLSVMYSSGARAQEICNLTVKDVMHDEKGNAIACIWTSGPAGRLPKEKVKHIGLQIRDTGLEISRNIGYNRKLKTR